ncbi:uncharacterized protein LOC143459383 isoform X2 [Clavelina lepadiformis]|uniref:uncharacterized protein LOC143459383 isoform X2 n=1 Tax=Clavelina lepadiformis TaxID=159417 RepID=UPI004042F3E7
MDELQHKYAESTDLSHKNEVDQVTGDNDEISLQAAEATHSVKNNAERKETWQVFHSEDMQYELDCGKRILSEIIRQNKTTCWPFMEPVDVEGLGLWDYPVKIKEPMWLNKITENFENGSYLSFADFAEEFRLMVENCYRYNTTDHPISKKAKRLEMLFEGKLALLNREIRETATISKTSNGRFATLSVEDSLPSTMRSGRLSLPAGGSARDAESYSQSRLVYDFVRCEETTLAEDERLANHRERKQQQALYQQIAAAFVSSLEAREDTKYIRKCHLLPEIGLFLHLNEMTLRLPPLAMYNLEMSLMIPNNSLYLAKLMTSFLCTYYERSLIAQRPPMTFKTWENRLKQRVEKWFEVVAKYQSYAIAADKLYIGMEFFHAMEWKNPFIESNSFLDLSYEKKAYLIKALCDNMTTFQSVQNHIMSLPCEQSRAMTLGFDMAGNIYTYFPQFCGDDVRIYKHRQFGELPHFVPPETFPYLLESKLANLKEGTPVLEESVVVSDINSSQKISSAIPKEDVCINNIEANDTDMDNVDRTNTGKLCKTVLASKSCETTQKEKGLYICKEFPSKQITTSSISDNQDSNNSNLVKLDVTQNQHPHECGDESRIKEDPENGKVMKKLPSYLENSDEQLCDNSNLLVEDEANQSMLTDTLNKEPLCDDEDLLKDAPSLQENSKAIDFCDVVEDIQRLVTNSTDESESVNEISDTSYTAPAKSPRKSMRRSKQGQSKVSTESPSGVRRSLRKRAMVNYGNMLQVNTVDPVTASDVSSTDGTTPKKRQKREKNTKKRAQKTAPKIEEPEEEYGSVDFEMVCDSVDALRKLIPLIEQEHKEAFELNKPAVVIGNINSLLERLQWLLGELDAFEEHLEKTHFDAKIRMKKEHDEILRDATTGKAIQTNHLEVDPWEDELLSKNSLMQGDNITTSHTSTPPASIYLEESEEEIDRELRRSKRKPKRYESDEDFVLDSEEESSPIHQVQQYLYDEFDKDRLQLLPAALEEFETRLQQNVFSLEKLIKNGRSNSLTDASDGNALGINERRTRQKSKKENKLFRKVYLLALKTKDFCGPSLMPLLRPDQTEIAEVIDRILAQEAVARQQRKMAREQEQRRKRAIKQALQQQNKIAKANKKAVSVKERKKEPIKTVPNVSTNMWTPPKKQMFSVGVSRPEAKNKTVSNEKAENVIIRLQNGKICQALRFSDGRIAPIVRVDSSTKADTIEDLKSNFGVAKKNTTKSEVPHISLTGNRANVASILKRSPAPQKQILTAPVSLRENTSTANNATTVAAVGSQQLNSATVSAEKSITTGQLPTTKIILQKPGAAIRAASSLPKIIQQSRIVSPGNRQLLNASGASQRLTLPSGQVISLVLPNQLGGISRVTTTTQSKPALSIGTRFVTQVAASVNVSTQSQTAAVTAQQNPYIAKPALAESSQNLEVKSTAAMEAKVSSPICPAKISGRQFEPFAGKHANKPLGIVTPIQVKNTSSLPSTEEAPNNPAQTLLSNSQRVPTPALSQQGSPPRSLNTVETGVPYPVASSATIIQGQSSVQTVQIGLPNVSFVSSPIFQPSQQPQSVQLMPTLMAGSVPIVQPVQFLQALPIIQAPVMLVAPSQAQVQVGANHCSLPTSAPSLSVDATVTSSS